MFQSCVGHPSHVTTILIFSALGTNAVQEKAKTVEDQSLGSSGSGSVVDRMDRIVGFGGGMRGFGMMGRGGPEAAAMALPELLRQLGRLGRLTVRGHDGMDGMEYQYRK